MTEKQSVNKINRNFMVLSAGEVVSRVVSFLAMVYVARVLGAELYGIIGLAIALLLYFQRLSDFGIEALGPKDVAQQENFLRDIAPSVIGVRLLISTALIMLIALCSYLWPDRLEGTIFFLFALILLPTGGSMRWLHIGQERAEYVSYARTAGELLRAALIFLLVRSADDVLRVPAAQLAGELVAALLMWWWVVRGNPGFTIRFDVRKALPVLRRSWPLVVTPLFGLMIYNADMVMLRIFRGNTDVGYYVAAYMLLSFIGNLGNSYGATFLPTFSRMAHDRGAQQKIYHTAIAQVFAIGLPIAVGGCLLAGALIEAWYGVEYAPSGVVLAILIWTLPVVLLRIVAQAILVSYERQMVIVRFTALVAIIYIILNLLVIPVYGMIGAAITTIAGELLRLGFCIFYLRKDGLYLAGIGRFWRAIFASTVMAAILIFSSVGSIWISIPLGMLCYLGALIISGGVRLHGGKLPSLTV